MKLFKEFINVYVGMLLVFLVAVIQILLLALDTLKDIIIEISIITGIDKHYSNMLKRDTSVTDSILKRGNK